MNEAQEFKGRADVEKYLAKLRADRLSDRTIEKERVYLRVVLRYMDKDPNTITFEDVERWKYEMTVNRKYEPETVWASMIILRKFVRSLGKTELAAQIEPPKRPTNIPPEKEIWLLPEEQQLMINKSKEVGDREHAIIRLLLASGIRAGELEKTNISDIDFDKQTLLVRHGKGDKSRIVCFDTETKKALSTYLNVRREHEEDADALFTSERTGKRLRYSGILYAVKVCAALCGFTKPITPHKLRHTFVTNVIERTKDIPLAKKLAGHNDIKTTMRYHHSTHEQMVAKYKAYFDSSPAQENMPQPLPTDEFIKALDTKFIRGELPYEVYIALRNEYATQIKREKAKEPIDYETAYR